MLCSSKLLSGSTKSLPRISATSTCLMVSKLTLPLTILSKDGSNLTSIGYLVSFFKIDILSLVFAEGTATIILSHFYFLLNSQSFQKEKLLGYLI